MASRHRDHSHNVGGKEGKKEGREGGKERNKEDRMQK